MGISQLELFKVNKFRHRSRGMIKPWAKLSVHQKINLRHNYLQQYPSLINYWNWKGFAFWLKNREGVAIIEPHMMQPRLIEFSRIQDDLHILFRNRISAYQRTDKCKKPKHPYTHKICKNCKPVTSC